VSSIKVRNSKPVRLVLEAANEQEEKKRRAIAFREATEEEKRALQIVSFSGQHPFSGIKIYRLSFLSLTAHLLLSVETPTSPACLLSAVTTAYISAYDLESVHISLYIFSDLF
jgi:hypothetical protein